MTDQLLDETDKRAMALLSGIVHGPAELLRAALEPTSDDYAAVFVGTAAMRAEAAYAEFWNHPPSALTRSVNATIRVIARRSQDIVASGDFPGGYARIAHFLAADQLWCRFKLIGNGGLDTIAYDGLVSRGERWAWFPKPWRFLRAEAGN